MGFTRGSQRRFVGLFQVSKINRLGTNLAEVSSMKL